MAEKRSSAGSSAINPILDQISQFNAGVVDNTLGLLDLGAQGVAGISNMITGRNDRPVMLGQRAKSALNVESDPSSPSYIAGSVAPAIATGVGAMAKQGVTSLRNFFGGSTAELGGYFGGEAGAQLGREYGGDYGEMAGGLVGGMAAPNAPRSEIIDAYHGSPHEFEQFSMDRIGTGEGAQVYGHGLYFAGNPEVARSYEKDLGRTVNFDGFPLNVGNRPNSGIATTGNENVDDLIGAFGGDVNAAIADETRFLQTLDPNSESYKSTKRDLDALIDIKDRITVENKSGSFYNVNLNVEPEDLLDYNASLAEQSPKVRKQIESMLRIREPDGIFINPDGTIEQDVSGRMIYDYLAEIERDKIYSAVDSMNKRLSELSDEIDSISVGYDQFTDPRGYDLKNEYDRLLAERANFVGRDDPREMASNRLRENGILGIQYLDGNSRAAGEGTRNYVIFDDSLIDTKRVNDQLTPSWMDQGARMQRAQDLGYDTSRPLYHYTDKLENETELSSLQPSPENVQTKLGRGIYTSPNPQYGDRYVRQGRDLSEGYNENARAIPVYARGKLATGDEYEAAYKAATDSLGIQRGVVDQQTKLKIRSDIQNKAQEMLKEQGFDGVQFMDEVMIFDPKNVRSINAEFDPTRADSADLLSSRQSERQMSALRGIA